MKKKMLICGANGFIGKNMLDKFYKDENYFIRATYNNSKPNLNYDVEWVKVDLTNPQDVKRAVDGVDIILQYAAVTSGAKDIVSKPHIHITDNVVMNSLLLREAFEQEIEHFIFPSCTLMYQSSDVLLKETDVDENEDIYEKYKDIGLPEKVQGQPKLLKLLEENKELSKALVEEFKQDILKS